MPPELTQQ